MVAEFLFFSRLRCVALLYKPFAPLYSLLSASRSVFVQDWLRLWGEVMNYLSVSIQLFGGALVARRLFVPV